MAADVEVPKRTPPVCDQVTLGFYSRRGVIGCSASHRVLSRASSVKAPASRTERKPNGVHPEQEHAVSTATHQTDGPWLTKLSFTT